MNKQIIINVLNVIVLCFGTLIGHSKEDERTSEPKLTDRNVKYEIAGGLKLGGASPIGMPVEIRKINNYNPSMPFFIQGKAIKAIKNRWEISAGLGLEGKGMHTEASVKGYQTTFNAAEDPSQNVSGFYYGTISTKVENIYLTIPILVHYNFSNHWQINAGPYIGYAIHKKFFGEAIEGYMRDQTPTGEKIGIEDAAYNFDKNIRNIDWGLKVGGKYQWNNGWHVLAGLDYSCNAIMKPGFESITFGLHNIYVNVGVGYRL